MTRNEMLARIAAILSTLLETNGSPESMLYIFCDMNMRDWEVIRDALTMQCVKPLIKISGHYVTLTDYGRSVARELDATIARKADTN